MTDIYKKILKRIKLFVLYWTKIVFVRNNFKVSFFNKLRANFGGGFLADQYVLYDLKHNSKKEYLSEFDWYRSRYINEPFDGALNNKVICTEMLKDRIRMPENLFIKNKGVLYNMDGNPAEYDNVADKLIEKGKLVMKPFALGKGNGVNVLSGEKDGSFSINDKPCSREELEKLLSGSGKYIISEYMHQHEYAAKLYDRTVNTIRLITIRDINTHMPKAILAVQRIGRASTVPVDNGSKGGLVARIDMETGRLSSARCLHDLETYEIHPDSKAPIEGVEIPRWQDIKEEILQLMQELPFMDMVAWDILVMEDGICVIEANTSSGINIVQLWGGQRQEELGEFFRYHKVIKK